MDHAFGRSAPFRLGVEEELLLVDPDTRGLSHTSTELLPRVAGVAGEVKQDVYESLVETAAPIAGAATEAARSLDALREALRAAGATLAGCGIHPTAGFGDVAHVRNPRYQAIAEDMRGLLRRTPTAALHVHVGMPDAETAVVACNGLREHLPVLQALAAHSPYWHGVDSGFETARAQLFRGYPRAVIPRHFAGWEDYVEVVSAAVAAAEVPDYTFLWWDLRPHPQLGTVEVRAMDAQARLSTATGLAALVHALAVRAAHEPAAAAAPPPEALTESSFRAGRDGLRATVWWRGALRPVTELAREAVELARPYARDVGADGALEEIERVVREGNGADRMRAAHARGGLDAVVDHLVAETALRPAS